jgi:predicted Zn-ribbon and HTH transcriptional regulator
MHEVRCNKCSYKLGEFETVKGKIRCHRCKKDNILNK